MEKVMESPLFAQEAPRKLFSPAPLFFVTSQYNLREILTGRYLGSVLSFDNKYYTDLLDLCPGRIPLLTAPLGREILDFVNNHDPETSFPVAVELNPRLIDIAQQPWYNDAQRPAPTADGPHYCYAPGGVIPPAAIIGIHFFTEAHREEFSLRAYDELPDASHLYRVSPALVGPTTDLESLTQWLHSLPTLDSPSTADYIHADRAAGASVLCAYRAQNIRDQQYIEQLAFARAKYPLPATRTPYWFDQGFYPRDPSLGTGSFDTNRILFSAVVNVLHKVDWSASRRKMNIVDAVEHELTAWTVQNDEQRSSFSELLTRARGYLTDRLVFRPFEPNKRSEYDVAKALLLFLMRPDPRNLLDWSPTETGADNNVMLTAAAFAGILFGRKSLSVAFRPDALDRKVSELIVDSLNSLTQTQVSVSKAAPIFQAQPQYEQTDVPDKLTTLNPTEINISELTPPQKDTPAELATASDIEPAVRPDVLSDSEVNQDSAPSIEQDLKSQAKALTDLKNRLVHGDYTNGEGTLKAIALSWCREAGWHSCVKSVLICPNDDDIVMRQVKQKTRKVIAFEVNGFAEIEYKLDEDLFKQLLGEIKVGDRRFAKFEKDVIVRYKLD
jgi:hypothetical protein